MANRSGISDNMIYAIKNKSKDYKFFAKIFVSVKKNKEYVEELSANKILSLVSKTSKYLLVPKIYLKYQDESFNIIVQSTARGEELGKVIIDAYSDRNDEMKNKKLLNSLYVLGVSVSELHNYNVVHTDPRESLIKYRLFEKINTKIDDLKLYPNIIQFLNLSKLQLYFENHLSWYSSLNQKLSYVHGDLSFSNIFFDQESNKITMIDAGGLTSHTKEQRPIGLPIYEIHQFKSSLRQLQGLNDLDDSFVDSLYKQFELGYNKNISASSSYSKNEKFSIAIGF
ncbi:MAG: hypothetical protein HOI53_08695 [Francisellaceae bacterium]|jgi:tRNA A-37 threonylcarbamoyl transferase component Bud32|nr:hypothetical protein [Francisellaceae bacterium]MBT6208091.1 hypothetical protein [Francisellaceae bacterium]MBT6538143.1 hypothetical protein [Francisellaceae bacterium]